MATTAAGVASFKEYLRQHRFLASKALSSVETEVRRRLAPGASQSQIILVHAPYPPSSASPRYSQTEENTHSSGLGCGKTDLLGLVCDRLRPDYNVIEFLDERSTLVDEEDFYGQVLLPRIVAQDHGFTYSTGVFVQRCLDVLVSLLGRTHLLLVSALPSFFLAAAALLAALTSLQLVEIVHLIHKPENRESIEKIYAWLQDHSAGLICAGLGIACLWVLHARAKAAKESGWKESWNVRSGAEIREERRQKLKTNPRKILERCAPDGKALVLVIDDADLLSMPSLQSLMDLFEEAKRPPAHAFVLILGFNPRNPALWQVGRSGVRLMMDSFEVRRRHWHLEELIPPSPSEVKSYLWQFFQNPRAEQVYSELVRRDPELKNNSGLILSFLIWLDEQRRPGDSPASVLNRTDDELAALFQRYMERDQKTTKALLSAVHDDAGAIELLKFLLAMRGDGIELTLLQEVTSVPIEELKRRIVVLVRAGILKDSPKCEFAQTHVRTTINSSWPEWRGGSEPYFSAVFKKLHQFTKQKDDPEIALQAEPTRLAVDVLWRTGEYHFNYFGASDAGYALRFYGLDRGALGKWIQLCNLCDQEQGRIDWSLVQWKNEARYNPHRGLARSQPELDHFAPNLVLTAGRLYWMTGEYDTAEHLLSELWPSLFRRMDVPQPFKKMINESDALIRLLFAQILYERARDEDWARCESICEALNTPSFTAPAIVRKAKTLLALIRYYRNVGIGNELPPFRLLQDGSVDELEALTDELPNWEMERLRPIYVLAGALIQRLTPGSPELPVSIDWETIRNSKIAQPELDRLGTTLDEAQKTLEEVARQRRKNSQKAPGVRLSEAEFLFWEGAYTLLRTRQFCLEALRPPGDRATALPEATVTENRFYQIYATAKGWEQFCIRTLLDHRPPSGFADIIGQIEALEDGIHRASWDEQDRRVQAVRKLLSDLYQSARSSIREIGRERLLLSEAVYRRLGSRQGMTAALFEIGLAGRDLPAQSSLEKTPDWIDDFEHLLRVSSGGLGFQLESLRTRVAIARWAGNHDLYRAVEALKASIEWTTRRSLQFPPALTAELAYLFGRHAGNILDASPFEPSEIISAFELAACNLDSLGPKPKCVSQEVLVERQLASLAWLSELYQRQANGQTDLQVRDELLGRALSHASALTSRSKREHHQQRWEYAGLSHSGNIQSLQGKHLEGFHQIEQTLSYYREQQDDFYSLQNVCSLFRIAGFGDTSTPEWQSCIKRLSEEHFPLMFQRCHALIQRIPELTPEFRSVLARATRLLGKVTRDVSWFERTFELQTSLGLYGSAILLDPLMEQYYKDPARREEHRRRIILAAQKLDRAREKLSWTEVGRILCRYGSLVLANSPALSTKREHLSAARNALSGDPPDLESGIDLLRLGRKLIVLSELDHVDLEILRELRTALYRSGGAAAAAEVEQQLAAAESTLESRDFLALAEHYRTQGFEYAWALDIAARADVENEYSRRANLELANLSAIAS